MALYSNISGMSRSLRVLARLLTYPDAQLRAQCAELAQALADEQALKPARLTQVQAMCRQIAARDEIDAQTDYVELFDRGRSTSLHLFEHVHGDSKDRGSAMIDLRQTYAQASLELAANELPDYLPVVLEYASTQPSAQARAFLGEFTHILQVIFSALLQRGSGYAAVLGALIELSGEHAQAVDVPPAPELDADWDEPAAFGGCPATQAADRPKPIHFHPHPAHVGASS